MFSSGKVTPILPAAHGVYRFLLSAHPPMIRDSIQSPQKGFSMKRDEYHTWTNGGAVAFLDVGSWAGAAAVEGGRVVTQSRSLLAASTAGVGLARAGAFGPR